jgi:predicted dinucleotide-binding enzyme
MAKYSIAILGAGNVGASLARVWVEAGHAITLGVPNPRGDKVRAAVRALSGKVKAATNQDAAESAQVVALCVPWPQAEEAIRACGNLSGKVLIDCTNPLASDLSGLVVGTTTSGGEQVAEWASGAGVVKAFNTIGAVNYGNTQFGSERADGFYFGDDAGAKATVRQLVAEAGFEPVDVGGLRNARLLEPLALLWIDLAVNQKQGIRHAFKLLRR